MLLNSKTKEVSKLNFLKTLRFPHPKAISDFLTPYIEKIVNKHAYSLGYRLNAKNMNNRNQFTMFIQGSRKLFEQLRLDNLKNINWQPTVEDGYFFYKK